MRILASKILHRHFFFSLAKNFVSVNVYEDTISDLFGDPIEAWRHAISISDEIENK